MWNYFPRHFLSRAWEMGERKHSGDSCVHRAVAYKALAYKTLRQKTGKRKMDVPKPMRPGDFYHERAREMMKRAEEAKTDDARASFLVLAGNWENLARQLERPSW